MWLVYLRFDDQGVVRTYHIRTGSRADGGCKIKCVTDIDKSL